MRVLSLGWGTQSFTLAAMAALGELPPLEAAVSADTTHEREATYAFAERWTPWLEERGVRVVTVRPEAAPLSDQWGGVAIPAYTGDGQIKRQCTGEWKLRPIRQWLRANRRGRTVDLLMGISLDEHQRMRDSDVRYIRNLYPLVDRRMTRGDCVLWLERRGLEVPPRSACTFCPFQSSRDWAALSARDRLLAIEADEAIRLARPPDPLFVHRACRPLVEIDLRSERERGQLDLWGLECAGVCGV